MIGGWDNLIDRCLLYAEAPRQMIKNLLMEAEDELSREVDIVEQVIRAVTPLRGNYPGFATAHKPNPLLLPNNFKKISEVRYKGEVLPLVDRDSIDFNTKNNTKDGTPTGYYIAPAEHGTGGLAVWLDKNPPDGDYLTVWYYAQISRMEEGYFHIPVYQAYDVTGSWNGYISLATDLGSVLDGARVSLGHAPNQQNNIVLKYVQTTSANVELNDNLFIPNWGTISNHRYSGVSSIYNHNVNLNGGEERDNMALVYDFRKYSPIVPQMYRISLCNYAIALSQAKANPEMHDKHYQMWLQDVEKIKNEQADKSLNHTIKEVI